MTPEGPEARLPTLFIIPMIQVIAGLLLFIALLNGQRDLIVLIAIVFSVVLGANIWSRLSLGGIVCHVEVDKSRVFPGETLAVTIEAKNTKLLPVWLQITLPLEGALGLPDNRSGLTVETGLLWFQKANFNRNLIAQKRGIYRLGPPRIKGGDLLGFFLREKTGSSSLSITVYPRLAPLKPFGFPKRELYGDPGTPGPVPDPIYLTGTRDYQNRGPARYIHWKASARLNRLQEKICEPSTREKVFFAIQVDRFEMIVAGIIRFIFLGRSFRMDEVSGQPGKSTGDLAHLAETQEQSPVWVTMMMWGGIGVTVIMALFLSAMGAWFLFRWLLSRDYAEKMPVQRRGTMVLFISWLWSTLLRLLGVIQRRKSGLAKANRIYACLRVWGKSGGVPCRRAETPTEYGFRLIGRFPSIRNEIGLIVDLFNQEAYGEISLGAKQLQESRIALKRLYSPRYWPDRARSRFLREDI